MSCTEALVGYEVIGTIRANIEQGEGQVVMDHNIFEWNGVLALDVLKDTIG